MSYNPENPPVEEEHTSPNLGTLREEDMVSAHVREVVLLTAVNRKPLEPEVATLPEAEIESPAAKPAH